MTAPERSCWTCRWANRDLCDRPHLSEEMDAAIDDYVVAAGCHKNGGGMPTDRSVVCPGHEAVLLRPREALALVAEVERLRAHRESCTANLLKGYETGKAEERAAVVAWLQKVADAPEIYADEAIALRRASFAIERGEHRREEEG